MDINVLDFIERSAMLSPQKLAIIEENAQISYEEFVTLYKKVGSALLQIVTRRAPVVVYMEKGIHALCAFFGIVSAGGCYSLLNPELPEDRLRKINEVLNAKLLLTTKDKQEAANRIFPSLRILCIEDLLLSDTDEEQLSILRKSFIDTDPLYINFTSGSTGTPKGIVVGHRSVIDFISCFTSLFSITDKDIIANQAPFDFDVSVKDIFSAFYKGCTLVIVPKRLFSVPAELIDFLCDQKVTTMVWAVSALCLISTFHGLDYRTPETVTKVLFSGEVMPIKHFTTWRTHLPKAMFVNLYGPTEITCNCSYHILSPDRDYSEGIPIGIPFPNEDMFLLDDENERISVPETIGEICVRGTALALGYFGSPDQNAEHFVQNPENRVYPELIYRTGDLAKRNDQGEYVFCGRKDFQVKYMGHRIELEEIERAMNAMEGVEQSCCLFDEKKQRLKGFFVGSIEREELHKRMSEKLPVFMIPGFLQKLPGMPLTKNGKIDRKLLI